MFGECHGHIFMDGRNYREAAARYRQGIDPVDVREKLEEYRRRNVTFYRDGGDIYGASVYARGIAAEYGIDYRTPVFAIHQNGRYGGIVGRGFDTMAEYRQLVREVRNQRGDFIKVMFSGILDFETDGHITGTPLDQEQIREMIAVAHEEGFAVMAHVNGARTIQAAAEAGVDSVEHGNFMDEECLEALAESGAVWVPTFVTIHNLLGSGRFDDAVIRGLQKRAEASLRRAYELGIPIALGSDAGAFRVLHGQGIVDEYREFQRIFADKPDLEQRLGQAERQIRLRFCHSY